VKGDNDTLVRFGVVIDAMATAGPVQHKAPALGQRDDLLRGEPR